jgi:hypothetical protein
VSVLSPTAQGGRFPITSDEQGRAVFDMALDEGTRQFDLHASCAVSPMHASKSRCVGRDQVPG